VGREVGANSSSTSIMGSWNGDTSLTDSALDNLRSTTESYLDDRLFLQSSTSIFIFLLERETFAPHVMVSAGVCFGGKGRLHFVDESAKVDSAYYVGRLLPSQAVLSTIVFNCFLAVTSFSKIANQQQHIARATQNWLQINCLDDPSGLQIHQT